MTDATTLKQIIQATLDRLNANGREIATIWDARTVVEALEQQRVIEAFKSAFSNLSLAELDLAMRVVTSMQPPIGPALAGDDTSFTHPPATEAEPDPLPPPPVVKRRSRKRKA